MSITQRRIIGGKMQLRDKIRESIAEMMYRTYDFNDDDLDAAGAIDVVTEEILHHVADVVKETAEELGI